MSWLVTLFTIFYAFFLTVFEKRTSLVRMATVVVAGYSCLPYSVQMLVAVSAGCLNYLCVTRIPFDGV